MKKIKNKTREIGIMIFSALCTATPAYAAENIASGIESGLDKVYDILKTIVIPIAVVACAICGIKIIWGNQKSAEEGKSALVRIVLGLAFLFLAPLLVKEIAGWFGSAG